MTVSDSVLHNTTHIIRIHHIRCSDPLCLSHTSIVWDALMSHSHRHLDEKWGSTSRSCARSGCATPILRAGHGTAGRDGPTINENTILCSTRTNASCECLIRCSHLSHRDDIPKQNVFQPVMISGERVRSVGSFGLRIPQKAPLSHLLESRKSKRHMCHGKL